MSKYYWYIDHIFNSTGLSKKMFLLRTIILVWFLSCSPISGIRATPGIQRKHLEEEAKFQWSVTEPVSSYSVHNQTLGYPGQLNDNANYMMDTQNGVVTLIIRNVQLSDAGNYSLSVTIGNSVQTDNGALLFVYGYSTSFVNQTSGGSGQQPATEGDAVELTCTVLSTSLPVAYRPKMYYQWHLSWIGAFLNISSGQATLLDSSGLVPGYRIKNDGRTLVIASAQYRDTHGISCLGREQWSPYESSISWFYLPLKYRPFIFSRSPASRKLNPMVGDSVSFSFSFEAVPEVTSAMNWTFVNTAGHNQDLPAGFSYPNPFSSYSLRFKFTSEAFYGNYSVSLKNSVGSTTETFQVLRPGPPDAPSSVRAEFISHRLIVIAWNCMWFNGHQQTTFLQLKALYDHIVIDSWNITLNLDCYDETYTTQFQNGIQSEMDYEVLLWSTNDLGSSDVVKFTVKTPKTFRFVVSPKTIAINGNQAIVNFNANPGRIARLDVTYCLELTGYCHDDYYYNLHLIYDTVGQIKVDSMPSGDAYVFDFVVYGGDLKRDIYYLTMVKGVRVSRNGQTTADGECEISLILPIIAFEVLLGVAGLTLVGCVIISFYVLKLHRNKLQREQQPNTKTDTWATYPTTQRTMRHAKGKTHMHRWTKVLQRVTPTIIMYH